MKKYSKTLIRSLMGAAVLTLAGCGFFAEKLTPRPELLAQVNKSETRARMHELDITSVELSCAPATHTLKQTVVGVFTFLHLDGREPLTVVGDTPCEKSGKLATWALNELETRADYTPSLLTGEVGKLLTNAKLAPTSGNIYNDDVSTAIMVKYRTVLPSDWRYITVRCGSAGARYEYAVYNDNTQIAAGSLQPTCAAAHQNYAVSVIPAADPQGKAMLLVRQFNSAQPAPLLAVFAELLSSKLPATKF